MLLLRKGNLHCIKKPKKKIPQCFPVWERRREIKRGKVKGESKSMFLIPSPFAFTLRLSAPLNFYKSSSPYNAFICVINYLYDIGTG